MPFDPFSLPAARQPDFQIEADARARQALLTKPTGSLGALEDVAVKMAAFQHSPRPRSRPAAVLLFAADHPVVRHGVSAYPQAVTAAMVQNFIAGRAASTVMARTLSVSLRVIDVGIAHAVNSSTIRGEVTYVRHAVASAKVGDLRVEDAMPEATYRAAMAAGIEAVDALEPGVRVLILGEMGIGNTTVAAAVCAAVLGGEPGDLVGTGTGVDAQALENKRNVVRDAVARIGTNLTPHRIMQAVGGRELAAMMGAAARALERGILVLVDGFIVTAAMLVLVKLDPQAYAGLLFAHRSNERAHGRVLSALGALPLLDLGLRLGEATGALAALPLLDLACALHDEMATFEEAAVPERI